MALRDIGTRYGTDKIICHGYDRLFPRYIDQFRTTQGAMLEIGVEEGRSLRMWRDYFPLFQIYGIDKDKSIAEDRIHVFAGDQSDVTRMAAICDSIKDPVYFINDDGSHYPSHQVSAFNILFPKLLQPGGIYILEDIETSYWKRGDLYGNTLQFGFRHPRSTIEIFKHLIDNINGFYIGGADKANLEKILSNWFSPETIANVGSIAFEQNCIIVRKITNDDISYKTGTYKHYDYVK